MNELDASTFPLAGHKVIEASAGTGKTYTITNLYLRLLLGESKTQKRLLRVNEILVLTFTNAATDELRRKIRERIIIARDLFREPDVVTSDIFLTHLRSVSTNLQADAKVLSAAVQLMDEAAIFTIHGFCARVLNEQPFETGILFDQQQDADTEQLLRLASEDFFRSYIQSLTGSALEIAIGMWPNPEGLVQKIKPIIGRSDIVLVPDYSDSLAGVHQLEAEIDDLKLLWISSEIPSLLRDCGINRRTKTFTRIDVMTEFCKGTSYITDLWENFSTATIAKNLTNTGSMPNHMIFERISSLVASLQLFEQVKIDLWHEATKWMTTRVEQTKANLASLTQDDLLSKVDQAIIQANANNSNFSRSLAKRWPVAMIDEFQDTDGAQYRIFSNIYEDTASCSLFMIGDPKQAIYQFRGADIYTYINAKRRVRPEEDLFSLGTNWRSTPGLIRAVNHLFSKPNVFYNDKDIPFLPVDSPPSKADELLEHNGRKMTPVEIFTFKREGKSINKGDVLRSAMAYTAHEISELLDDHSKASEDRSTPDIAVLVRDRIEMKAAKLALDSRGIRSVYVTQDSVFDTHTASDLLLLLTAAAEPNNVNAIRSALATRLCQNTAAEIDAISQNITVYQTSLAEFQQYHDHWAKLGVAAMIGRLIEDRHLAQKWLSQVEGDRELTNLRHLGELLQNQAATVPGMRALVQWFADEIQRQNISSQEDRQLRLDTDRELIKLVTMHASKGLEYDIVFIPMSTISARKVQKDSPSLFHDEVANDVDQPGSGFITKAEIGNNPTHIELSRQETAAENMRLLYVAITRAKQRCYLGIAPLKGASNSPISTLLGLTETLETDTPFTPLNELPTDLFSVIDGADRLASIPEVSVLSDSSDKPAGIAFFPTPIPLPAINDTWRMNSYTGISRLLAARGQRSPEPASAPAGLPGYLDDDPVNDSNPVETEKTTTIFDQYHFPKGPKIGVALHDLLENLDFTSASDSWTSRLTRFVQRVGITQDQSRWVEVLRKWLVNILATDISCLTAPDAYFSLKQVAQVNRLNELEFFFPLDSREDPIKLLIDHGYLENDSAQARLQLKGVMTGYIDLIVEQQGKFYVIDYKSNMLGTDQSSYSQEHIKHHMTTHRYHLQYLIYCVAVNRYLATRIRHYDYDTHFGGVHYLFLRGMQRQTALSGVFADRPAKSLIQQLDHCLMNRGPDDV